MSAVLKHGLTDALRQGPFLDPAKLRALPGLEARFPEPRDLAKELVRLGWLTALQANRLLLGRAKDLLLGPYVLLERLGQGGMGRVFKARHRAGNRLVALKVVRKDRRSNPTVLSRFQREIQAARQLCHPNVVAALDAAEADGTLYLALEYVPGTDLGRLVRDRGPLPVGQACDYIRQAALGLQHAFERGVVHRDLKPQNLMVTARDHPSPGFPWGRVKILDLGLARLDDDADGDQATLLTVAGMVLGTPDFIAPEQAWDAHGSDVRSDLYSLGCTFYYLLTGQVPFPKGTFSEKLIKHQHEEPDPVEKLRRDVPPAVAAVVRRLLAKRPEDRYQTPAELAQALGELLRDPAVRGAAPPRSARETRRVKIPDTPLALRRVNPAKESPSSLASTVEMARPPLPAPKANPRRRWLRLAVGGGLCLLGGLALLGLVLHQ